jgi:prevent-host-death family protein
VRQRTDETSVEMRTHCYDITILTLLRFLDNPVSMTRNTISRKASTLPKPRLTTGSGTQSRWVLQDAKARFSELVRRVHSEGPQHVTVHGRDEVVVVSAQEFKRLKGSRTGQSLIDTFQSTPFPQIDISNQSFQAPVRNVKL